MFAGFSPNEYSVASVSGFLREKYTYQPVGFPLICSSSQALSGAK